MRGEAELLNNSAVPRLSVAAVAKKPLRAGDKISQAFGSFEARGKAVRIRENYGHVPIGLLNNAVVKREIEPGQMICFDNVEMPENTALTIWREIESAARARVPSEQKERNHVRTS